MRGDCLCSKGLRLGGTCLLTHTGARDTHCLISPQRPLESEWWWCSVTVTSNSDPMDYSPPGSSVHGILQARMLEWVIIPSPRDLPRPGIKIATPALKGGFFTTELPGKPPLRATRAHYPHFPDVERLNDLTKVL